MQRPLHALSLYLLTLSFLSLAQTSALPNYGRRSVVVDSIFNLPLIKNINQHVDLRDVLKNDQSRVADLISKAKNRASGGPQRTSIGVQNMLVTYTTNVGVGVPPTTYTLLIDTGSSNTWVGANTSYVPTSTSQNTNQSVSVTYGSGAFSGTEYTDRVDLGNGLVIDHQSIGVADTAEGFSGVDGILGIGPTDLTLGTLSPMTEELIPTVTDNLFAQGKIPSPKIGIYYTPSTDPEPGELTFGGTDSSKYVGDVTYAPMTQTYPASLFWGINQTVTYGAPLPLAGKDDILMSNTAGIVDTGTTLLLLATDYFQQYQELTGGVPDDTTGLLKITLQQYAQLKSLFFQIGFTTFQFTPNAQIWPRVFNTLLGGTSDAIYLIVADLGQPSGEGLDFINGYAFLQRFYSVYDTLGHSVGFATTPHTYSNEN